MIKLNKTQRAFVITDTHYGARSNSVEWMKLIDDYMYNVFIPTIKKYYKSGDILIHSGDFFDNRQSLNLSVLNNAIKLIEDLSEIFKDGIYLLVGNHDIFKKNSNDITSLDVFKHIKNVNIIKDTEILNVSNKNIMLMPWRHSIEMEREDIKNFGKMYKPEYLFCHTNVATLKFNNVTKIEEDDGLNIDELNIFKYVYSGHIHTSQKNKNITIIGNPYQMTRSDAYNKKGFYLIDFENDKESFFENKYSPKFIKIYLHNHLETKINDLINICKNNKVDLYIDTSLLTYQVQISILIDKLSEVSDKLDVITYDKDLNSQDDMYTDDDIENNFNILNLCKTFIQKQNYPDDVNNKLFNKIEKLYKNILSEKA